MKQYTKIQMVCQNCGKTVLAPSIAKGRFKYCMDCRKEMDRRRHRGPQASKERDKEERRTARARDGIGGGISHYQRP